MSDLLHAPDLSTPRGLRDRALLETLYASGMRVSELVGLNIVDLARADGTGGLRALRVLGKGRKERVVILGEAAVDALSAYCDGARPICWQRDRVQRMTRFF